MARILAIDYGTKRTGIAVSDPLKIIASGLTTIDTNTIWDYLSAYFKEEEVELLVVGEPLYPDGNPAQIHDKVMKFVEKFKEKYPNIAVALQDERYTSEEAKAVIRQSGAKKKKRQNKALVDTVSAAIILKLYMEQHVW